MMKNPNLACVIHEEQCSCVGTNTMAKEIWRSVGVETLSLYK